jgi:hypothetical protein
MVNAGPTASSDLLFTIDHLPFTIKAPVAQLDRASDFGSEGRRFEPCWVHQYFESNACDSLDRLSKVSGSASKT